MPRFHIVHKSSLSGLIRRLNTRRRFQIDSVNIPLVEYTSEQIPSVAYMRPRLFVNMCT